MKRQIKKIHTHLEKILNLIEDTMLDGDTDYEICEFLEDVIKPQIQETQSELLNFEGGE